MFEELIRAELRKQGLSEDLASQISVQKQEEIEAAVIAFKAKQTKKGLSDFLKENGYEADFQRMLQSETDKRVTQALQTFEKKMKDAKGGNETTPPAQTTESTDPAIKSLQEQMKTIADALSGITTATKQQTIRSKFIEAVKAKGIPEVYASHVAVESEDQIETVVEAVDASYKAMKQSILDEAIKSGHVPPVSTGEASITEGMIKDFAETKKSESAVKIQPLE